jgi:lipoprotein-releasing system permease protein
MPFELVVALRYLREGRGQTWLILTGIAVGVAVIVYLSALITGLQASLIEQTLGTQASIVVRPPEEMPRMLRGEGGALRQATIERPAQRVRSITQWQHAVARIESVPGVVAVATTVDGPAMAIRGQGSSSIFVRGVEPGAYERIVALTPRITRGAPSVSGDHAIIGSELASDLGLDVGDTFRVRVGEEGGSVHTVAGIIDLGARDLNARWVFVSVRSAQAMFGLEGGISTIAVKVEEIFQAETVGRRIAEATGLDAESWMEANAQLLVALRSQSSSSYLIQVFVMLAVALGIASVLAVSVVQKTREIGILRATGAPRGRVSRIFLLEGAILGLVGAAIGIGLGSGLALFFSTLARSADGSPTFPVALGSGLFLRAALLSVLVGIVAAALPARRAARLDPAAAIHDA